MLKFFALKFLRIFWKISNSIVDFFVDVEQFFDKLIFSFQIFKHWKFDIEFWRLNFLR